MFLHQEIIEYNDNLIFYLYLIEEKRHEFQH